MAGTSLTCNLDQLAAVWKFARVRRSKDNKALAKEDCLKVLGIKRLRRLPGNSLEEDVALATTNALEKREALPAFEEADAHAVLSAAFDLFFSLRHDERKKEQNAKRTAPRSSSSPRQPVPNRPTPQALQPPQVDQEAVRAVAAGVSTLEQFASLCAANPALVKHMMEEAIYARDNFSGQLRRRMERDRGRVDEALVRNAPAPFPSVLGSDIGSQAGNNP